MILSINSPLRSIDEDVTRTEYCTYRFVAGCTSRPSVSLMMHRTSVIVSRTASLPEPTLKHFNRHSNTTRSTRLLSDLCETCVAEINIRWSKLGAFTMSRMASIAVTRAHEDARLKRRKRGPPSSSAPFRKTMKVVSIQSANKILEQTLLNGYEKDDIDCGCFIWWAASNHRRSLSIFLLFNVT